VDVFHDVIKVAEQRHAATDRERFITSPEPDEAADYGLASDIFNVRLDRSDAEWFDYLQPTLEAPHQPAVLYSRSIAGSRTQTRTESATISITRVRTDCLISPSVAILVKSHCFMTVSLASLRFWLE
jgi:hypothetical protein